MFDNDFNTYMSITRYEVYDQQFKEVYNKKPIISVPKCFNNDGICRLTLKLI